LQKTGRRDPVECKGSIDEAVIDGEEDQKWIVHLFDWVDCVLILCEFIDAGCQLATSFQTNTP
jgi:hypothetical protein